MRPAPQDARQVRVLRPHDACWWAGRQAIDFARNKQGQVHRKSAAINLAVTFVIFPFLLLVIVGWTIPALLVIHACVGACGWALWRAHKHHRGSKGLDSPGTALLATGLTALGYVGLFVGEPRLSALWSLLISGVWLEILGRHPKLNIRLGEPKWSDSDVLVPALVASGGLKTGGMPADIQYVGKPRRDDAGEWVTFRVKDHLPPHTFLDFDKKDVRANLAAKLGIARERLHIEEGDRANRITIAVLHERKHEVVKAELPERADWSQPIPLGKDRLGRLVDLVMKDRHTILAGATGSGKTSTARFIAAHAILDPRVPMYVISGKDDQKDWRPMRDLCVRYAGGADEDDIRGMVAVLQEVQRLSESRKDDPDPQPVLLIVDEWFLVRSNAAVYDKEAKNTALVDELDSLFARLAASARSRGVQIMLLAQRGTSEYIPKPSRANFAQKLCGFVEDRRDAHYVLDTTPEYLPSTAGEFYVKRLGKPLSLVQIPHLDDQAFVEVCERAKVLRFDAGTLPLGDEEPRQQPHLELVRSEAPPPRDMEVWKALRDGPAKPSDVMARLPEHLRPAGVQVLGRDLARMEREGVLRIVWGGPGGKTKMFERAPGSPWGIHLPGGKLPPETGSGAAQTPSTGTDGAVPPVPAVVP